MLLSYLPTFTKARDFFCHNVLYPPYQDKGTGHQLSSSVRKNMLVRSILSSPFYPKTRFSHRATTQAILSMNEGRLLHIFILPSLPHYLKTSIYGNSFRESISICGVQRKKIFLLDVLIINRSFFGCGSDDSLLFQGLKRDKVVGRYF